MKIMQYMEVNDKNILNVTWGEKLVNLISSLRIAVGKGRLDAW